jgi:hypothetical protein
LAKCTAVHCTLAADPEVPGSIPDAIKFSEYQWVWNGVHLALEGIKEELLEKKVTAPVYKTEINDCGDPSRWPRDTPLSAKVGITFRRQVAVAQSVYFARGLKATEFVFDSELQNL